MVFSSLTFLGFFLIVFLLYWLISDRGSILQRNAFIVVASYVFYGWWDWRFLGLIFVSSLVDFVIGRSLGKEERGSRRKWLVLLSLLTNLGILGYFKYANFFIDSLNVLLTSIGLHGSGFSLSIILPVGISFYTFQTLSYTLDIYHQRMRPTRDPVAFFAFVSFFPQLVAGPIERASHLLPQFAVRHRFSYPGSLAGLRLLLWGLFKKLVIADNLGRLADLAFAESAPESGLIVLIGTSLFAIQIYADFSGYSDMAIGISRMMGFDLRKNFITPYLSSSFREFWQRWHISLSTWFRDYLYIPLGGNRISTFRTAYNIFLTFVISGLWHGANVTFLIWGALHGMALIAERRFNIQNGNPVWQILVIISVLLFWLPFRAESLTQFMDLVSAMFNFSSYQVDFLSYFTDNFLPVKLIAVGVAFTIFAFLETKLNKRDFHEWISNVSPIARIGLYYLLLVMILLLTDFDAKPSFIYFQF